MWPWGLAGSNKHHILLHSCGRIDSFPTWIFEAARKLKKINERTMNPSDSTMLDTFGQGKNGSERWDSDLNQKPLEFWSLARSCQQKIIGQNPKPSVLVDNLRYLANTQNHQRVRSSYGYVKGRSVWGSKKRNTKETCTLWLTKPLISRSRDMCRSGRQVDSEFWFGMQNLGLLSAKLASRKYSARFQNENCTQVFLIQ